MKAGSSKAGTFDAYRLARERGVLTGSLDVEMSERLEDRIAPGPGTVAWRIEGAADELGRPAIAIDIEGAVPVTCQRCLSDFALPVEHRTVAVLARSEKEADASSTPAATTKSWWRTGRSTRSSWSRTNCC